MLHFCFLFLISLAFGNIINFYSKIFEASPISFIKIKPNTDSNDENLSLCTFEVKIGSQEKNKTLIITTDYSSIGLLSTNESVPEKYYNYSESSTFKNLSIYENTTYFNGSMSGYLCTENIRLDKLEALNQEFYLIQNYDKNLYISNGWLGFGYKKLGSNSPSFVETLKNQNKINETTFAFHFSNSKNGIETVVLIIGEFVKSYTKGDGVLVNTDPKTSVWDFPLDKIQFDTLTFNSSKAILSISSGFIIGPKNDIAMILKHINSATENYKMNASNIFDCPCKSLNLDNYLDLIFTVNETELVIKPMFYTKSDSKSCTFSLKSHEENSWILGQPFYEEYFIVHDLENAKITIYESSYGSEESYWSEVNYVVIGVILLIIISIIIIVAYMIINRKKSHSYMSLH